MSATRFEQEALSATLGVTTLLRFERCFERRFERCLERHFERLLYAKSVALSKIFEQDALSKMLLALCFELRL